MTSIYYGSGSTQSGTASFQTLSTDPAGFSKLSSADRYNRLLEVRENPTSVTVGGTGYTVGNSSLSTYTTSYGYDFLDDLTSVGQTDPASQSTLSRGFSYDSFKRLVQAMNPETGTCGSSKLSLGRF